MAQKVNIVFIDDVDGTDAEETVTFGLDGTNYEIDLNTDNAAALRFAVAPFIASARKSGRSGGRGSAKAASSNGSGLSREDRDAVRVWSRTKEATKAGVAALGERGRIPEAAATAWQAR